MPLRIMMKSTGKLIQCIHRIASGCLRSSRMVTGDAPLWTLSGFSTAKAKLSWDKRSPSIPGFSRVRLAVWGDTGYRDAHAVNRRVRGDVQGLEIRVAPGEIPHGSRKFYGAEVLTCGRKDPNAHWARAIDVSPLIHLHPIRCTMLRIRTCIAEYPRIGQRPIRSHRVTHPKHFRQRVVDVKILLIG